MRCGLIAATLLASPAAAVTCSDTVFEDVRYTACAVNADEDLRLYHSAPDGTVLGHFDALATLRPDRTLTFAMNAGMYHEDRAPVGLYRENGAEVSRVVTSDGPGNFGLLPNGVLCLNDNRIALYETRDFVARGPECRDASQSGPMLVIEGALHPRFIDGGTSKHIRNGVGTTADGQRAVFVIANDPVNFHSFARFFRDVLGLPNALYFDGSVSRLYAPQINRDDFGFRLGPMIAVFE